METFALATVHLGWPPGDFWAATPRELFAAWDAHVRKIEAQAR